MLLDKTQRVKLTEAATMEGPMIVGISRNKVVEVGAA
jgi:hypothetical protein